MQINQNFNRASDVRFTSIISHIAFITCLVLQRFGIGIGHAYLSISVPMFFVLFLSMLIRGCFKIRTNTLGILLVFFSWVFLSTIISIVYPENHGSISLLTLINLSSIYSLFIFEPTKYFHTQTVHLVFLKYARFCALLGILQFSVQFLGLRFFSFEEMFPLLKPILIEHYFSINPYLKYGSSIWRSNGFFLLEASIFSQILVIAIVIDYFIFKNNKYLPLYLTAYITTFSGTGLLAITITLLIISFRSTHNFNNVIKLTSAGFLALLIAALIVPEQVGYFIDRFSELGSGAKGSSGYARFYAQKEQIQVLINDDVRSIIGYGPGSTVRSSYWVEGSANPALQIYFEYGFVGLFLFILYMFKVYWNSKYAALSVILLLTFQLGGGNLQFAPFGLLFAAIGIWGCEKSASRQEVFQQKEYRYFYRRFTAAHIVKQKKLRADE